MVRIPKKPGARKATASKAAKKPASGDRGLTDAQRLAEVKRLLAALDTVLAKTQKGRDRLLAEIARLERKAMH